jgi:hypothetical protein
MQRFVRSPGLQLAIGAVARKDNGLVLAALSAPTGQCKDVEEAEAKAILAGLHLATEQKLKFVFGVRACAVAAANERTKNYSQNWSIYKYIILAKSLLTSCTISSNNIATGMVRGSQVRFQSIKNTLSLTLDRNVFFFSHLSIDRVLLKWMNRNVSIN